MEAAIVLPQTQSWTSRQCLHWCTVFHNFTGNFAAKCTYHCNIEHHKVTGSLITHIISAFIRICSKQLIPRCWHSMHIIIPGKWENLPATEYSYWRILFDHQNYSQTLANRSNSWEYQPCQKDIQRSNQVLQGIKEKAPCNR